MMEQFFKLRVIAVTSVIFSFLGAIVMFLAGCYKTVKAILVFVGVNPSGKIYGKELEFMDMTMIGMIEAVDAFLFALVMMIFSYGIYLLFIVPPEQQDEKREILPKWMHFHNITELKLVLAEVIVIILFVIFLEEVLMHIDSLEWTLMIFPISILLLASSLRLLHPSHDADHAAHNPDVKIEVPVEKHDGRWILRARNRRS